MGQTCVAVVLRSATVTPYLQTGPGNLLFDADLAVGVQLDPFTFLKGLDLIWRQVGSHSIDDSETMRNLAADLLNRVQSNLQRDRLHDEVLSLG